MPFATDSMNSKELKMISTPSSRSLTTSGITAGKFLCELLSLIIHRLNVLIVISFKLCLRYMLLVVYGFWVRL